MTVAVGHSTPVRSHRVTSPAKLNLTLAVRSRRADGFHDLESLVIGIDLRDEIRIEPRSAPGIEIVCGADGVPTDARNLVVRAAEAIAAVGQIEPAVRLTLCKRIAVSAGLGGGSGNAAATLVGLNRFWSLNLPDRALAKLAATLGSDVSLFLKLPAGLISGRGDVVSSRSLAWSGWVVLAGAGIEVSTPAVYAAWDQGHRPSQQAADTTGAILAARSADTIGPLMFNELEPAVFAVAPKIKTLQQAVQSVGGRWARVSGAGATVFQLFDREEDATAFANRLRQRGIGRTVIVVPTLTDSINLQ